VTAYLDRALSEEQARAVAERLRADHPGVEVVLVSPAQRWTACACSSAIS